MNNLREFENEHKKRRRDFLYQSVAAAGIVSLSRPTWGSQSPQELMVGEGVVDITPPLGIELAGFHRPLENPRKIISIRRKSNVRALVLRQHGVQVALVSLDMIAVSQEMAKRVQSEVERRTGIPASQIRICATHTHSMPTFRYLRQWGAISPEYMRKVEGDIVRSIELGIEDLAAAELLLGKAQTEGANFNRTTNVWKTDREFDSQSTDEDRWLDTTLHTLMFKRSGGKKDLLWYHFSAHPVCYTDDLAGPDWPGLVDQMVTESHHISPGYLQGHIGDVNPGDGRIWIGEAQQTATAVYKALVSAIDGAQSIEVDVLRSLSDRSLLPFDMELLSEQVETYRKAPDQCASGEWVDAAFSKEWFEAAEKWDRSKTTYSTPLSVLQLGPIGMLFHSAELYSFYGLALRRDSGFQHTLCVGYTDDFVGYLTDPKAYTAHEYAAVVVPKVCDVPPFKREAAASFTTEANALLKKLLG